MFSKELENLIQATLEDGMLEDYEKVALQKRAQAEGVDLTELEIYINSIMQKRKKEADAKRNAESDKLEALKKEEFGKVCPNCGKQVASLALVCECGYEFKKEVHVSPIQVLLDKITDIQTKEVNAKSSGTKTLGYDYQANMAMYKEIENREQAVLDAIRMFPVPSSKEDILDFLSTSVSLCKRKGLSFGKRCMILILIAIVIGVIVLISGGDGFTVFFIFFSLVPFGMFYLLIPGLKNKKVNAKADAWREKFNQVMMKGRSLRADAEFTRMLDYYEEQLKKI